MKWFLILLLALLGALFYFSRGEDLAPGELDDAYAPFATQGTPS